MYPRRRRRVLLSSAAVLSAAALALGATPASAASATAAPIQPVPKVDVARYLGSWYQLADLSQFYETFCLRDTTATYALNADGTVAVTNTCAGPIGAIKVKGTARVLTPATNAQLQVSFLEFFGKPVFPGSDPNYVVIGLADDYSWAVVGAPDHKSAYVLSRTRTLTPAAKAAAVAALTASGYDACSLTVTKQTGGATTAGKFC